MGSTFVLFILLDLEIQKDFFKTDKEYREDWIFEELEWWEFDLSRSTAMFLIIPTPVSSIISELVSVATCGKRKIPSF